MKPKTWGPLLAVLGATVGVACSIEGEPGSEESGGAGGTAGDSGGTSGKGGSTGAGTGGSAGKGGASSGGSAGSSGSGGASAGTGGEAGAGNSTGDAGGGGEGGGGTPEGNLPFTPSNIPDLRGDGLGDVVLSDQNCEIDTDAGTISCVDDETTFAFSTAPQADGPDLGIFRASSFLIEQSAQVKVVGSHPLVLLAFGGIDIRGGLDATSTNTGVGGGFAQSPSGKGGGAGGGAPIRNYAAGGGGAFCGKGGDGGFDADDPPASVGGKAFGTPELLPLFGGASGGGTQGGNEGGAGGGAIQLVASTSVTVGTNGYVSVGGGGGHANGGGAGSGGAILIEAPLVTINGTLAANGGGGAIFNGGSAGQSGLPGDTAALGSSQTAGVGSAGDTVVGGSGTNDGNTPNSSGGGGGGAGRIRINSSGGDATVGSNGVISPSLTTDCATQGTLEG